MKFSTRFLMLFTAAAAAHLATTDGWKLQQDDATWKRLFAPEVDHEIERDVPDDLRAICMMCLRKDPHERPTAAEVCRGLAEFLDDA